MDLTHLTDRVIHAFDAHLGVLLDALPGLLSGLLVLLVGWLIARVLRWTTGRLLKRLGLDAAAEKSGLDRQLQRFGGLKLSKLIGLVVYWAVLLVFLLAAAMFKDLAGAAGIDGTSAFAPESYDAAALIMLSMAAAGSSNSADFAGKVMDIANAPGEKIYPGELAKALDLIAAGTEIDYEGASAVELVGPGESKGNYQEILFADGVYSTVNYR